MSRYHLNRSPHATKTLAIDPHNPQRVVIHTEHHDDEVLHWNQRMRLEDVIRKGAAMGVHDGARLEFAFRIPSAEQWDRFCKDHPDVYARIRSKDEAERALGCRQLLQYHPEWSTMSANR